MEGRDVSDIWLETFVMEEKEDGLTRMANFKLVKVTSRRCIISDSTPSTMPLFNSTERG